MTFRPIVCTRRKPPKRHVMGVDSPRKTVCGRDVDRVQVGYPVTCDHCRGRLRARRARLGHQGRLF